MLLRNRIWPFQKKPGAASQPRASLGGWWHWGEARDSHHRGLLPDRVGARRNKGPSQPRSPRPRWARLLPSQTRLPQHSSPLHAQSQNPAPNHSRGQGYKSHCLLSAARQGSVPDALL